MAIELGQVYDNTFIISVDSQSKTTIFPTHYRLYTSEFTHQDRILHVYNTVFHGFASLFTHHQLATISNHPSVLAVFEERRHQLHTTRSPQFLGLRNQCDLWSESDYDSNVIIGVFDIGPTELLRLEPWPHLIDSSKNARACFLIAIAFLFFHVSTSDFVCLDLYLFCLIF
ncbi:hypothetical protein PIB30_059965 [Stylosanthes scabra]|uniref:Inhibitor I9 domain-containing protein n=1 Tax=Stylosanthes scabra TaxID=79078 RepID=A0ABU6UJ62_9FABA|nr:hypothetical protein [Stylosanthes scabra]